jgi:hypothetical protein
MESAHPIWNLFGGELAVAMLIQVLSVLVHSPFNFFFLCIQLKSTFIFLPSILGISGSEAQTGSSRVSLLLFAGILVKMHKNIYSVLFTARDN